MNILEIWYHKYFNRKVKIGKNVRIGKSTIFELPLWIPYVNGIRVRKPIDGGIIIKDNVDISGNCTIVYGCETPTIIREGVYIAHNSIIGHDCVIGKRTIISASVTINGMVNVGEDCFIASGTVIQPRLKVGKNCFIGSLSMINKDIPDYSVAFGIPCKRRKESTWRPPE